MHFFCFKVLIKKKEINLSNIWKRLDIMFLLFNCFRTERLARNICRDVDSGPLVGLCVLKGGYQFFGDLMDYIRTINANGGKWTKSWNLETKVFYLICKKILKSSVSLLQSTEQSVQMSVDFIRLKSYEVKWEMGF